MKVSPSELSVVIPSFNSGATIERVLEGCGNLDDPKPCEIIVVDSSTDGTGEIVASRFPRVTLIRSHVPLFAGAARNQGWRAACGTVVAFIDSDCIPSRDWHLRLCEGYAREDPLVGVGGAIGVSDFSNRLGWVNYLCQIAEFAPGHTPRHVQNMPGGNASYRREVLEETGGFPDIPRCQDMALCRLATRKGLPYLFYPPAVVFHCNREGWGAFFRGTARIGQGSAQIRKRENLPGAFTVKYPVLIPLLIPFRLGKILRVMRHADARYYRESIRSVPLLMLALSVWTWGYARGALMDFSPRKTQYPAVVKRRSNSR